MKDCLKMVFPACFGSSAAVTAVAFFRHIGVWGIADFVLNFLFMFIITEIIVAAAFWVWKKMKKADNNCTGQ